MTTAMEKGTAMDNPIKKRIMLPIPEKSARMPPLSPPVEGEEMRAKRIMRKEIEQKNKIREQMKKDREELKNDRQNKSCPNGIRKNSLSR